MSFPDIQSEIRNTSARERSRGQLLIYLVASGGLLLLCVASIPLLHLAQGSVAIQPAGSAESAWFLDPGTVSKGVTRGYLVEVAVLPVRDGTVDWKVRDAGRLFASAQFTGVAGRTAEVKFTTAQMLRDSWVSIQISGLTVPLKVWIR